MTDLTPSPVQGFFGGLLMVVGALMGVLCGLCTAVFLVGGLFSSGGGEVAVLAIVIGGIPTGIGVGLFVAGRSLRSGGKPPPKTDPAAFD